jgi:hypothetical protein
MFSTTMRAAPRTAGARGPAASAVSLLPPPLIVPPAASAA